MKLPRRKIPRLAAGAAALGVGLLAMPPAEFGKFVAEETEKWRKVVKFAGLKPE